MDADFSRKGWGMRRWPVVVIAAVVGLFIHAPLVAHHGGAAFDTGVRVVLEGTVTEWLYSNPHCLLRLEVTNEDGETVVWVAEGQAPHTIFPAGYRKDSFTPGDRVTVTVEPAKESRRMGRILESVLADGRTLGRASSAGAIREP
jgi:hypothetical protein